MRVLSVRPDHAQHRSDVRLVGLVILLIFAYPSTLRVNGLGYFGWLPLLVVLGLSVLLTSTLVRQGELEFGTGHLPVGLMLLASVWTAVPAFRREMTAEETSGLSQFFVSLALGMVVVLAIALVCNTLADMRWLVACAVGGATCSASIGVVQAATGWSPAASAPQGIFTSVLVTEDLRNGLTRQYGSATHPLEFATVLVVCAPLALWLASSAHGGKGRLAWGGTYALLTVGVVLSQTRTGLIGLALTTVIFLMVKGLRALSGGLLVIALGLAALAVFWNAQLSRIINLFTGLAQDTSVQERLVDYGLVLPLVKQHPFLGLGAGTFRPLTYFFLDNQFLAFLLEGGAIGLTLWLGAMILPLLLVVTNALRTRESRQQGERRLLVSALSGGWLSIIVGMATFDYLSFPQCSAAMFMLVGFLAPLLGSSVSENPSESAAVLSAGRRAA